MVIMLYMFFFFNDTATTEIYTLSLHDALPIFAGAGADRDEARVVAMGDEPLRDVEHAVPARDDHLRIGRVAGAERGTRHLGEDDLDREDRRLLLLVRFEPDLVEPALHARAGQGADLDRYGHAFLEPT